MTRSDGQAIERAGRNSGGTLSAGPTRVNAIHKLCATALLCLLASASCHAGEEPSSLDVWKRRFHRDRQLVKQPGLIAHAAIPAGFALLGETEEAIRISAEFRTGDDVIVELAGLLSRIDRLDEALALAARIGDPRKRERTVGVVVHSQVNRGDLADGLRLLPQLPAREQDDVAEKIIRRQLDAGQFDRAAEHLKLIQEDERRGRLQQLVDETRAFPPAKDPSYIEKKVDAAQRERRQRQEGMKDSMPAADAEVKLITCLATANHLHARRDEDGCRRELRAAWSIAAVMTEEDRRIGQQMAIACAAMECEAREVAKEMFTDLVGNPKSDGYYAAFSVVGLSPMLAVAELFSKEELRPAVQRWQRADFDLPSDYMAFAEACAKIRRFDQLEWLYGQTESAELRLMVTVTALEGLVQNRK